MPTMVSFSSSSLHDEASSCGVTAIAERVPDGLLGVAGRADESLVSSGKGTSRRASSRGSVRSPRSSHSISPFDPLTDRDELPRTDVDVDRRP